jgi:protein phosphatase
MNDHHLEDTAEYGGAVSLANTAPVWEPFGKVEADIAAVSHPGKVRVDNEDHYLVIRGGRSFRTCMTNLPAGLVPDELEDVIHGIAVADGMGGCAGGEVASREAIAEFVRLVLETPDWIFGGEEPYITELFSRARQRFQEVNAALLARVRQEPELRGMGTTLTLAWNLGNHLIVAHVGDSRAYLLRHGELHRLTRDHTRAEELAARGAIARVDIANHRLRHVLTDVVGGWKGRGVPDIDRIGLENGDRLLVCTDGLTEMVDDATIAAELQADRNPSADLACQSLLKCALQRGGKDNVTIVVAAYKLGSSLAASSPGSNA